MTYDAARARTKRPIPLWADAFLRDTMSLPAEAVGAYMLILMAMWSRPSCDLPDNDRQLATIARISTRSWTGSVGPMIRPFLTSRDGTVTQERLLKEANYVEVTLTRQSDRKTGKSLKDKEQDQSADTSAGVSYPTTQQPNLKYGGGGNAGARARGPEDDENPDPPTDVDPTFRGRILAAMGVDPISGLTGRGGQMLGQSGDMQRANRWLTDLDLTEAEALQVIAEAMARKRDGPPGSFSYFDGPMTRFAGAKHAPPLKPEASARDGPRQDPPRRKIRADPNAI